MHGGHTKTADAYEACFIVSGGPLLRVDADQRKAYTQCWLSITSGMSNDEGVVCPIHFFGLRRNDADHWISKVRLRVGEQVELRCLDLTSGTWKE